MTSNAKTILSIVAVAAVGVALGMLLAPGKTADLKSSVKGSIDDLGDKVDDLIDTGGTMTKAAELIMSKGAKSVRAICTHPVLSGNAYDNINNSVLTELVVTDTLPLKQESAKIKQLTVSELFANAIMRTHNYQSISSLFIG